MAKIIRKTVSGPKKLFFDNLSIGDCFVINSAKSTGVIYMKCVDIDYCYHQLEIATGKLFDPTTSVVSKIDVEIHVYDTKS